MEMELTVPASIRAVPVTANGAVRVRRLAGSGCEVLFVTAHAGVELPRHEHDTDNATLIISGHMVLITDSGETRHGPGEWYQTSAGEMHALRFEADTAQIELRFRTQPT